MICIRMLQSAMKSYVFKNVPPKRSKIMRSIRSENTSLELRLRRALFARGLRYRLHRRSLPGKPDIVFPRHKLAIFCDSEFWHGKDLKSRIDRIRSNRSYWKAKIEGNRKRDKQVNKRLRDLGWRVLRFWEHDILTNLQRVIKTIENEVDSDCA